MTQTLDAAITDALDRLGDLANTVWSRDEIGLYLRDGYDLYCRRTKCLFDIYVIENLPPSGNWQTDLEKYLAQQIPGMGLTDSPFHFTNDFERNYGIDGRYGGSYAGPAGTTLTRESTIPSSREVVWASVVGATASGNDLTKTASSGWDNAGAVSAQQLASGDGYVETTVSETNRGRMFGLSSGDTDQGYADIDFAFYMHNASTLFVYEGGTARTASLGTYATGDILKVAIESGVVKYYQNDTLLYTSLVTPTYPILVDTALNTISATITDTVVDGGAWARASIELATGDSIPTAVPGGLLPQSTVDVLRVTYDDRELYALGSAQARRLDPNYESRSGDPQFFTFDKDGIFFLRLIPNAQGDAVYDTVSGSWGTMTYTDDTAVEIVTTEVTGYNTGGYGILRYRDDMFPTHGPWGTPTRIHPTTANTKVEVYRLGRSLDAHPFELPDAYLRYPLYWAMSRALHRDGPGQDMELADHFEQRFEMGIHRMTQKRAKMDRERVGSLGGAPTDDAFSVGWPQAPYPYQNR